MADYKKTKDAMAKQAALDEAARKKKIEGLSDEDAAAELAEKKRQEAAKAKVAKSAGKTSAFPTTPPPKQK